MVHVRSEGLGPGIARLTGEATRAGLTEAAPEVLREVVDADTAVMLVLGDPRGDIDAARCLDIEPSTHARYVERYRSADPLMPVVLRELSGTTVSGIRATVHDLGAWCGRDALERTPYFREFLAPAGLCHMMACAIRCGADGPLLLLGAHRRPGRRSFTRMDRDAAELLAPVIGLAYARAALLDGPRPLDLEAELGLTPREAELVAHVCRGARNRDIADALGISVRTVENHLRAIYDKAGVRTRTELAARLHRAPGMPCE